MVDQKPLILVIDDDENILLNLKTMIELQDYSVITEKSGVSALKTLREGNRLPDLIICDRKMPKMSGIDFFGALSKNTAWAHIPFIFLTGLNSPKEIRKGKSLGVDDYLTKPINQEELLAVIKGKLKRKQLTEKITKEAKKRISNISKQQSSLLSTEKVKESTILFIVEWDDRVGPQIQQYYPKNLDLGYPIEDMSEKLYQCSRFIYGSEKISEPEGLLINLSQIKQSSYLFFDSYPDPNQRSGSREFMVGILSPHINYFKSKILKKSLKNLSNLFKEAEELNLEQYWSDMVEILGGEQLGD